MKKKNIYIIVTFLIITSLAAYGRIADNHFINLDDPVYITKNYIVQHGLNLQNIKWAFTTKYADLWHPLTWLSLMFDNQLFGLNAGGYHLTNLILHILSTLLLFWLFYRMTHEMWKSAFVAALFALHPLHVESVAWISERKDVLSAFFWMLTLCFYVYYTESPALKRYGFVVFAFILALMSKPMVVTLPVIMILLDYWPLKRFESQISNLFLWQLKEKLPLFVLSLILVFITLYTPGNQVSYKLLPLDVRLANAPIAFVTYLIKTFWPHDMTVFYPFPAHIPTAQVMGASLMIIIISIAILAWTKRLPYLFVGWFWFAITIAPVIGIIQISFKLPYAMADRYHYLPSIGIAVMLAWGTPFFFPSENIRKKILFSSAIVILFVLAILTWKQCGYWKSSVSLFNHTLHVTKNNNQTINILGLDYTEIALHKYQSVIQDNNKVLPSKSDDALACYDRALTYAKHGQYQRAIADYNKAIRLKPDYIEAYNNRGNIYGQYGLYQLAMEDFNKVIAINPHHIKVYNNRGRAYSEMGQYQKAIEDFNRAIHLKPDYTGAYINRANAFLRKGNRAAGCQDAHTACELGDCKTLDFMRAKGFCR